MTRPWLFLSVVLAACSSSASAPDASPGAASLLSYFDLPRGPDTQTLSGMSFDPGSGTLYALKDRQPQIVPLLASSDDTVFTIATPIALTGRPSSAWDGEGLARATDGTFYALTVETRPLLERFSSEGAYLGGVELPARFADQHPGNMGIESLSLSPSGTHLFFANEGALIPDGAIASKEGGTRIRIHRRDLAAGLDDERAYLTDATGPGDGGSLGVSDVTALDEDRVLVLERGYQAGYGNTVRIYRTMLSAGPDVSSTDALDDTSASLEKQLVLDLVTLPSDGVPTGETQPNPLLDNFEALALGPLLADGRRVVFVLSDDNASAIQVARILVLALPL